MFSFYFLSIKCFVDHYKQKEKKIAASKKWIPRLSLLRLKKLFSRGRKISDKGNATFQGHPTTIFGKKTVRKTIWDLEFLEHFFFCKISCLPASPRIFEHLQIGIITHFLTDFCPKKGHLEFSGSFSWLKFSRS